MSQGQTDVGVASGRRALVVIPAPLRRPTFRRLWAGMTASYAGDRLQQLAQAWLVATLTGSTFSVGLITVLVTLPLLLLPVGGAVVERLDRRRLLIVGQLIGAASAAVLTLLVVTRLVAVWHVYVWAVVCGLRVLLMRPAYKVVLTESVPSEEVRAAVAINSTSETGSLVLVNAGGSILLGVLGLPIAFALNTASYVVAAASIWTLPSTASGGQRSGGFSAGPILRDVVDGWRYLVGQPSLLRPLTLTLLTVVAANPLLSLLAAIVHAHGGSIVELGWLAAGTSAGSLAGAMYAGSHDEGVNIVHRFALFALFAAAAVVVFAVVPVGLFSFPSLSVIGFVLFAEAVWNTSRVRKVAASTYQARLQAFTSMAFTLGIAFSTLWAGIAIDRLGLGVLLAGASILAFGTGTILLLDARTPRPAAAAV